MQEELRIRVIFEGESVARGVPKAKSTTDALAGSVNDLTQRFKQAQLEMNNLVKGTAEWAAANKNMTMLQNQLKTSIAGSTGQVHSIGTAFQAMNFTIRDSPYFFRNFSLGVLAVGNNINPMIDSLIRVKHEAKALNSTLGKELLKSLMGPAGIVLGFSVLVTVIQAVVFAMDSADSKQKDVKKSLDDLIESNKTFIERLKDIDDRIGSLKLDDLPIAFRAITGSIKDLNDEIDKVIDKMIIGGGMPGGITNLILGNTPEKITELVVKLQELRAELTDIVNLGGKLELAQKLGAGSTLRGWFSDKELGAISDKFKELGGKLIPKVVSEIDIGGTAIRGTREEFLKLSEDIDKLIKPAGGKAKSVFMPYVVADIDDELEAAIDELSAKTNKYILEKFAENATIVNLFTRVPSELQKIDPLIDSSGAEARARVMADLNQSLRDNNEELSNTDRLATMVGQSLYQAFLNGKLQAGELLKSLLAIAAQLVIIEGIKYLFNPMSSIFGPGAHGGIVGDPYYGGLGITEGRASGGLIGGSSYMTDRLLVPSNSGEMMLNRQQQTYLFNSIASGNIKGMSQQDYQPAFIVENSFDGTDLLTKITQKRVSLSR